MPFIGTILVLALALVTTEPPTPQLKGLGGGGIVYGDEIGIGLSAPRGWVFDDQSGVSQGLHAVMYPEGSSWKEGTAVMYFNFGHLDAAETLASWISDDIVDFKKKAPGLAVETADPITIKDGSQAEVRLLAGDAWGNHEAIAYIAKGSGVAIYVLSCRNKDAFQQSLPAFREVVAKSFLMNVRHQ